jgi:hypothetical protein
LGIEETVWFLTVKLALVEPQAARGFEAGCWALTVRVRRRKAEKQVKRRAAFMGFPSSMRFDQYGVRLYIPGLGEKDAGLGRRILVEAGLARSVGLAVR